ncbi:MAG TPA: MFS transporter [Candidatus Omnitrophota bacterium]|nr:MFS transporter [Candidatus Omnitrophota bacterium]
MFNIILLGITSLLTDIASEMVYPILPIYLVVQLGAGPVVLGIIEGIAESLASLTKVFSGYFSDRFRLRKPFAIAGYAASTLGKFFLYLSTGWGMVLVGRTVDRFGKGIRTAPRDALIAESARRNRRGSAFGLHRAMDTFGACIGVWLAYLLIIKFKGDYQHVFLFSIIPAFFGVIILFFVREKRTYLQEQKEKVVFRWKSLDRRLKLFLVFTFIFTLGNSSNQFLLLRAQNTGNSLAQVILMYLAFNIIYSIVSYPAAHLSDHIGRKKLLVAGYLFYAIVYLGFAITQAAHAYWFLFAVYGLYMACTEGVEKALVADIAPSHMRATAIGLHATIVGIGLLPASLLAGAFWHYWGASAPFYFGGIMGVVASIGFWFILKGV